MSFSVLSLPAVQTPEQRVIAQASATQDQTTTNFVVLNSAKNLLEYKVRANNSICQAWIAGNTIAITPAGGLYSAIALTGINFDTVTGTPDWNTTAGTGLYTYTGTTSQIFKIHTMLSVYSASNSQVCNMYIKQNGTIINMSNSQAIIGTISGASAAISNMNTSPIVLVNPNDTFQVFINNATSNNNIIVYNYLFNAYNLK